MPMIRYQIRNEYGLADPELYGTTERDDPEALLEAVAMAGLVGILRQLGDLAEFAAEIFHDLHEEVMATAARGHGLMLRVQQLEAEFPSIEKTFFTQTNNSSFACNDVDHPETLKKKKYYGIKTGIDWHASIQMDQNLITRGDMPRFILDSYEECRGPPHLFTLDKFDVAGAGACLKRYSDPSFFKMELASSGMLETELPREKKARKIKKKGSRRKNGQTLESLLAPDVDSDLQQIASDKVSEKTLRHVRLKTRHSNGTDKSDDRCLMKRLLEIHSSEQNVLFGSSISHSHVKINPIDSNESATEIREIAVDASADHPLIRELNLIQSPIEKEVTRLPLYESEMQKIKDKELPDVLHDSFGGLKKTDSDYNVVEQKEMSAKSGYKSEVCLNGYVVSQPETPPSLQVVDQNKSLGDAECITEGGADDYRSDDISSELDNFVDALNTMESELETDCECRGKAEAGVFSMESHGEDSDINEAQQELQAQFSEQDSVDDSAKSLSSNTMLKNEITSISESDTSTLAVAQPTQRNMVSLDWPANLEICPGKTYNNTTETDCKGVEKSDLVGVILESHAMNSDNNEGQQELQAHFSEPDSVDDSTKSLSLNNMFKNETTCVSESDTTSSPLVAQPTQRNMVSVDFPANSELCPAKIHDKTTEELWQNDEDMKLNSSDDLVSSSCIRDSTSILVSIHHLGSCHESQSVTGDQNGIPSGYEASEANEATKYLDGSSLESNHLETPHPAEHVEELISEDMAETFDMPDFFSQIEDRSMCGEVAPGYIEESLLPLTASIIREPQESTEPDPKACSGGAKSPTISAFSPDISSIASKPDSLATELENGMQPEDIVAQRSSVFVKDTHDIAEEFDSSSLGTKDDDVLENIHPSDHSVELNSEDMTIMLDVTDHHCQTRDECILEKVPPGSVEDSTVSSTEHIGETQESMKQDTEACLCGSTSPAIPALSPDISSTVQPEGSAAEMENVVAPSEHLACPTVGLENAEEMAKYNILVPNTLAPELEYFSDAKQPQEFPHVVSAGFTHLCSLEESCLSGMQLQCNVPNQELIECPIPVDDNLKLLDEPPIHTSQDNTLQTGEPPQCDDLVAENAIFEHHSDNANPSSTYSPETSGLDVQSQEYSLPNVGSLYQHQAEKQEAISLKDKTALDSPSIQENTLQTGEPTQCDDLVAENAIFEHHSDNAHPSSTYSPEISGLHVQPQEYSLPDVAPLYQHQVEKQEAISPKDKTASDSQSIQENTLQTGELTRCDDRVAENAILEHHSDNAHPSSTYSPETSGLHAQSQEYSLPDVALCCQHDVEKQAAISPKDKTVLGSQSIQYMTLSEEDQPVAASTAFDPDLSILCSSDPSDSRLLPDVCQTKSSGDVQTDLHSGNDEANSVCSLENKQDFVLKALPYGGCISTEEKMPPSTHFLSEPTIPLEEAAFKLQVSSALKMLPLHQEGEPIDLHAPTIDLDDEPAEEGPELRSYDSAPNADVSELDMPLQNKAMSWQVEPEASISTACSSEVISSSLASNVSAVMLPSYTSSDAVILETSSQLPGEPVSGKPVSSLPFQNVEEPPPLPPLPPLEWRRGKLQLGSLLSAGSLFQPPSGTNESMASSAADWKHGQGLLVDEGEMVKPANPFVTIPALEAESSQHGLLKSEGEKMHAFRLSELLPVADDERDQHDAPFLEGRVVYSSNPSLVVSPVEDEKHLYCHNSVGEVMLQPSNPFASLSVLEDEISQCPPLLPGETLPPTEVASSQPDQLLSSELERDQESGHGCLNLERETVQPPKTFLVQSDIEDGKHQYGSGICGVENMHLLQSSVSLPTTEPELPKPGYVTSREDGQSSQIDDLPTSDGANSNVKPCSIRNRPRDPLIEAVAAHDRSAMRKVSEMVRSSNKPKADERDSLLEQIRSKSFNLKPAVVTKPSIKGPPTNLKVAAIIEKANAIRQAFVGSDEDNEDSWSDS